MINLYDYFISLIAVEVVLGHEHELDGHILELKKAIPKGSTILSSKTSSENKLFVGGLAANVTNEILKSYFESRFGEISDASVMMDRETGRSRGFGFVTFNDSSCCLDVLDEAMHTICGKNVQIKRAEPLNGKARGTAIYPLYSHYGNRVVGNTSIFPQGLGNTSFFPQGLRSYEISSGMNMYPSQLKYYQMRYMAMLEFQKAFFRNGNNNNNNYYSYAQDIHQVSTNLPNKNGWEDEEESDDDNTSSPSKKRRY